MLDALSRIRFTWRLVGLTALPFAAFLGVAVGGVVLPKIEEKSIAEGMVANIGLTAAASELVNALQKERGMSAVHLNGGLDKAAVDGQRRQSDAARAPFEAALARGLIPAPEKQRAREGLEPLGALRAEIDARRIDAAENILRYTRIIDALLGLGNATASAPTAKGVGKALVTISLLEAAKENAGKLRATMSSLLAADRALSAEELQSVVRLKANVDVNLNSPALVLAPGSREKLSAYRQSEAWKEIDRVFVRMVQKAGEGRFGVDGAGFFRTITTQVDDIGRLVQGETAAALVRATAIRGEAVAGLTASAVFVGLLSVALAFLGWGVTRSIARPLQRVSGGLNAAAAEVSAASMEIAAASQSLAEGASQQAAAIEETSAALEEMAATTRRNADHATQADDLMGEVKGQVADARSAMERLGASMQEISQASAETQKIVRTIDEIAFQTNLLALNAAVEAARAGAAGAGFAVVADEVRNLAVRAAEAARNTSALIEGTVAKVQDGCGLMNATGAAFDKVAASAGRAAELMAGIAAASKEQSVGIAQLNTAVSEMDKVTQQNAASSEESASASEQLSGQAQQLRAMVDELIGLLGAQPHAAATPADGTSPPPRPRTDRPTTTPTRGTPLPADPAR